MEIVKLRYETMQKALLTLQKGLEVLKNIQKREDSEEYIIMRDGLIQRFEYCIDSFWKFIKLYLEVVKGTSVETTRPKEILKLALDDVIALEEYQVLIDAILERNLTSHSYNENLAIEIQDHIPAYFSAMKNIIDRIKIDGQ